MRTAPWIIGTEEPDVKKASQALVLLLMIDAAWIAWGLAQNRIMWGWIAGYWVILTIKNLVDYVDGRKKN